MRKRIALAFGAIVLILVNVAIVQREQLRTHGQVALLELAPVDPRSLMQGDYMMLRFALDREIDEGAIAPDGKLVLQRDAQGVARFVRVDDGAPLKPDEMLLRYRVRKGRLKLATNAFFFQEGTADTYSGARYGEFRVDGKGDALLTGLRDENLAALQGRASP
ncbi:MAG: GDYXXLXY domain-containing protein [Azoarcus sp.]|jgi:uncharacterized membrane-anchored protein|nr:GDYXXLXY domain-containing protein [Azoarcus sp.]